MIILGCFGVPPFKETSIFLAKWLGLIFNPPNLGWLTLCLWSSTPKRCVERQRIEKPWSHEWKGLPGCPPIPGTKTITMGLLTTGMILQVGLPAFFFSKDVSRSTFCHKKKGVGVRRFWKRKAFLEGFFWGLKTKLFWWETTLECQVLRFPCFCYLLSFFPLRSI